MQLAPTKRFVSDDEFDIDPLVILIQSPILKIELTPLISAIVSIKEQILRVRVKCPN